METCANCPPGQSGAQTVAGARNKVPPAPLCPHAGYCISTRTSQSGGKGVGGGGGGGGMGRGGAAAMEKWEGGGEEEEEEVVVWWLRFHPMRRLLTGSPCLEKSPLWSCGPQGGCTTSMGEHSLVGGGLVVVGGIRERMRNREEEVRVRQTALLFFTVLGGASGDSKACEKAQGGRRCGKTSPSFF